MDAPMKICGQCGEMAVIGGFAAVPGKEVFEAWRCLNCLLHEVRTSAQEQGRPIKNVLIVKPEDKP